MGPDFFNGFSCSSSIRLGRFVSARAEIDRMASAFKHEDLKAVL